MTVEIVATKNGHDRVAGGLSQLDLRDGDGNLRDLAGKSRIFLCRCGASITNPFCDGHHTKIGFQAARPSLDIVILPCAMLAGPASLV